MSDTGRSGLSDEERKRLFREALAACETEPIHIPGSIQPIGVLIGLREPELTVTAVSANVGIDAAGVLGRPWTELVPGASVEALRSALAGDLEEHNPIRLVGPNGRRADAVVHRNDTTLIVELEPPDRGPDSALGWYQQLRRILLRLQGARTEQQLAVELADQVRALTGFDRVMVYRFDQDWNGEVTAEAAADGIGTYLDLRFPAGDIPPQARALYRTNWLRLIPSSVYEPVPLLGHSDEAVDLSGSLMRGVSPVHLHYLANMGVAASMSLSLVVEGELWGLVSCHHYAGPLNLPYRVRAAAELVARTASILLESVSRAEQAGARAEAAERRSALTSALAAGAGAPGTILVHHGDELLHLVGADGAVVRLGGSILTYGTTLDGPTAVAVADRLLDGGAEPVATDCLADVDPAWARLVDVAAGALVAPVGKDGESWLLWTAGELRRTVTWGGDPENKELRITDQGPRLNPRRSFEAWTEELSGRSRLWSPVEIEVAGSLARNVADQLLRRSVARDQVAGALARTLLLERIPDLPGLRVAVRYLPAADSAFGGDWYDVLYRPDGHVAFALGDVAGHGIEAASITAQLRQGLRAYLLGEPSPATVLSRLNDLCTWVLPDDMATALVVDVDPSSGAYTWASAGHLPPLLAGAGGSLLAGQRGPALGLVDGATYRVNEGRLSGDDLLVLYSDGLIERRDTSIDERLRALSSAMPPSGRAPGALCDLAIQAMGASAGSDDVTVLAFGLAEA